MIELKYPENGSCVSLQTSLQKEFTQCGRDILTGKRSLACFRNQFLSYIDPSRPARVIFRWEYQESLSCVIEISKDADFSDIFISEQVRNSYDGYNFEIGKTYYWRIRNAKEESPVWSFKTENITPRFMYCDGTTNVRDMGGHKTYDGKLVKQSLLYRGSELDMHLLLTDAGIKTMRDVLRIKSDVDFRGESVGFSDKSRLGNQVKYFQIPLGQYEGFIDEKNHERIRKIFHVLSDIENYPIYIHCLAGADRTGCIALVIDALLGIDEETLFKNYEYTTLTALGGIRTRDDESFKKLLDVLRTYGENWKERAENFLKSCGVTQETIEGFREIMLEKP